MTMLIFYMKSGNTFKLRFVKDWKVFYRTNRITQLTVERNKFFDWLPLPKMILSSVDLLHIEAILRVN